MLDPLKPRSKRYSWIAIAIISTIIAGWDYYIWLGWQWIFEHDTCYIHDMATGEVTKQICWGTSPLPIEAITIGSAVVTVYWIYRAIENYIESGGKK